MMVVKAWGVGRDEEMLVTGYKLPAIRLKYCRDLMHSMVTIVINNILCTWNLLREWILNIITTKKNPHNCMRDGGVN